jgi:hypothetical protein
VEYVHQKIVELVANCSAYESRILANSLTEEFTIASSARVGCESIQDRWKKTFPVVPPMWSRKEKSGVEDRIGQIRGT